MTPQDPKLRLVIAVLDGKDALWPTLRLLAEKGIDSQQIGLIALAATVARLAGNGSPPAGSAGLLDGLEVLSVATAAGSVVASPCLVHLWRTGIRLPALWENHAGQHLVPRLASDIESWVARGFAVIAVAPMTPEQQWATTRVLLAFSSGPVETLEYSLTAEARAAWPSGA
ncbi:MAG: hypothetical protein SFW09_17895 [Hyphomicrobiaceae bacterium]|nr:hypothetical protein [Hyphomicrobiaceae bacterium]